MSESVNKKFGLKVSSTLEFGALVEVERMHYLENLRSKKNDHIKSNGYGNCKGSVFYYCKPENLSHIREFLSSELGKVAQAGLAMQQLIMAIDEIAANRIIHEFKQDPSEYIYIHFEYVDGKTTVTFADRGKPYHDEHISTDDLGKAALNNDPGVGVAVIRTFLDKLEVVEEGGMTKHILTKYIPARA